ncbi:unnamed protein product [Prunus brigantina]
MLPAAHRAIDNNISLFGKFFRSATMLFSKFQLSLSLLIHMLAQLEIELCLPPLELLVIPDERTIIQWNYAEACAWNSWCHQSFSTNILSLKLLFFSSANANKWALAQGVALLQMEYCTEDQFMLLLA